MKKNLLLSLAAVLALGAPMLATSCDNNPGETSSSIVNIANGGTLNLGATGKIETKLDGELTWTVSDESIATVASDGTVTPLAPGEVTITVSNGTSKEEYKITIADPDSGVSGKVNVDYDALPVEILPGKDNAVKVADYVEVTGVGSWYLTTSTPDVVKIEGQTFYGLTAGEYTVTLHAGKTVRALTGYVISENKVAFNQFYSSLSENWISYSAISGLYGSAEDYFYYPVATNEATQTYTLGGSIHDTTNDVWRNFTVEAAADATGASWFTIDSDTFEIGHGYAASKEIEGLGSFTVPASSYHEISYRGEATGMYYIEEDGSNSLTTMLDSISPEAWSNIVYYCDELYGATINGAMVYLGESNGSSFLTFYPAIIDGDDINYIDVLTLPSTSGTNEDFPAYIQVSDFGTANFAAADAWVKAPTTPDPIPVTPLDAFFDNMAEKKSYTMTMDAAWKDNTGKQVETPDNMKFTDTHQDIFSSMSVLTYANENAIYTRYGNLNNNNVYCDTSLSMGDANIQNNHTDLKFIYNGAFHEATGIYDAETGNGFNVAVQDADNAAITDIWADSILVPTASFGHSESVTEATGGKTLFEMTSFTDLSDGKYYFNSYGPDRNFSYMQGGVDMGLSGVFYTMLFHVNQSYAFWTAYYLGMTGYLDDYCDCYFTVTEDEFAMDLVFNFSATTNYYIHISYTDVGVDNVPEDAKAYMANPYKSTMPTTGDDSDTTGDDTPSTSTEA